MSGDCFLIEKFSYSTPIPTVSMEAAEHVRGAAEIFWQPGDHTVLVRKTTSSELS